MRPKKCLIGFLDMDDTHVKGILEHPAQEILIQFSSAPASEAQTVQFFSERHLAVFSCGIQFKRFLYKWAAHRINNFRLARTSVKITQRGLHRIKALLQPAVETFLGFLT